MKTNFGRTFGPSAPSDEQRGWRVGHQGRDRMYYEERHAGVWERIDIDGEMLTGRAHHVIYFATPERWLGYPEWARKRREEIIARITSEFREPGYEYYGIGDGGGFAPAGPLASNAVPTSVPARTAAPPPSGKRALLGAVLLLFALAAVMGWLVTRGMVRGETYYPTKRAYLRRTVSRQQEPGMFWISIGVYAAIGTGVLTLGVLGVRAGRRLGSTAESSGSRPPD